MYWITNYSLDSIISFVFVHATILKNKHNIVNLVCLRTSPATKSDSSEISALVYFRGNSCLLLIGIEGERLLLNHCFLGPDFSKSESELRYVDRFSRISAVISDISKN